jgi:hypothetical protein
MALFRRRSADEPVDDPTVEALEDAELAESDQAGDGDAEVRDVGGFDRSDGPFDETEVELADDELPRLDLGSLRIPGLPGISVQLEADEATQQVHAVTAIAGEAAVQLRAFAAPRSEGLWDSLRADTLHEIRATAGARVTDGVGAFGPELRAIVPARSPEGQQVRQPVRFAGVDGPRWFLQVVFLGKAAVEPDPTDELHQLVRQTIVVRGSEAMAPGQPLGLTLPAQPAAADQASEDEGVEGEDDAPEPRFSGIDPYERGPEINEVR